ncbi:MAG TPA: class I SAM-dependent methyltransferase [Rhodocyclaceae bacterium]|nr:class I SAM-dependent methyltransferase [Rhodocyclaceae bacterium]
MRQSWTRSWGNRPVRVLEIGAGAERHAVYRGKAHVVGLDISEKQLERHQHIDEKICADIERYDLPPESFDVIVCWWLLEHLAQAAMVLNKCVDALRPDGVLVIACPNPISLKGIITKYSPHWFHVMFYRYVYKFKDAGRNDQPPFATYLDPVLIPHNIQKFAANKNLAIDFFHSFEGEQQKIFRRRHRLFDIAFKFLDALQERNLLCGMSVKDTDYIAILRKT